MTPGEPAEPLPDRLAASREALEAFLAQAAGARAARLQAAEPLTGGAIQENWLLRVAFEDGPEDGPGNDSAELVLRTDAPSGVAASRSRMEEFALLRAAWAAGVPVPEALWLDRDAGVLGRPFYVMRRVPGTAAGHKLVKDGAIADPDALAEQLGEALAHIHGIVPPRDDLAFLGTPPESPAHEAIAGHRAYLDSLPDPHPDLEWGLRWCERQAPESEEITLVHQDFRTGNYMVHEGALSGVLDWEFCDWGDPISDIGWFCAKCWRFGRNDREAGGIAGRAPFYRGYERVSGRRIDPEAVAYWEVMAHLRWAVIALQQGERFNSGGEASLELALTGRLRPAELALEILRRTGPERWTAAP